MGLPGVVNADDLHKSVDLLLNPLGSPTRDARREHGEVFKRASFSLAHLYVGKGLICEQASILFTNNALDILRDPAGSNMSQAESISYATEALIKIREVFLDTVSAVNKDIQAEETIRIDRYTSNDIKELDLMIFGLARNSVAHGPGLKATVTLLLINSIKILWDPQKPMTGLERTDHVLERLKNANH